MLELAHGVSSKHRQQIQLSHKCGCFHCLKIFSPAEIVDWEDNGQTAVCPYCSVDSIIGDWSNYPVTPGFLKEMKKYWF